MDSTKLAAPTLTALAADSDYDPNSMPVAKARAYIRAFLSPVTTVERVQVRSALGRILAEDITSGIDVPGHDNSAMDGYAMRFADLEAGGETALRVVGRLVRGQALRQAAWVRARRFAS